MIIAVSARSFTPLLVAVLLAGCSSEPAHESIKPAAAAPVPAAASDARPVIVTFGDSLSAGYGLDPADSYPSNLQRLLDAAGYGYHVVNMGVSGDTTTDGVTRMPDVIALHPGIVILEFGGNDGLRGQPVTSTRDNLSSMIESLQKAGAKVVLAGITLPRNYGPDYIKQFDAIYPPLTAKYKLTAIPFLLEGVGGNPALTQQDGLHPTAEGCRIVANTVMKYLTPLLKK
jgi:acyl-CoA thioesterase-1